MDEDHDLEHSPLSGRFTRDDITVEVEIDRVANTNEPRGLEMVDRHGGCTAWHEHFATEQAALAAFVSVVGASGIMSFAAATPDVRD